MIAVQQQRRLDAAHLGGEVAGRVAVVVDTVEQLLCGADTAEQAPERGRLAAGDGDVEGVAAADVHHLGHVGAAPEQRLDGRRRAVARGDVQRPAGTAAPCWACRPAAPAC